MTAVAVEITQGPDTEPQPTGLVLVDDVEALTEGTTPGCGDDNPYQ
jgi:hypothetical protein